MTNLDILAQPDLAYDYTSIADEDDRHTIQQCAADIKPRLKRAAEDIVVIGQRLGEVKERLPHGQWLPWLQTEFDMSDDTARNFMRVAERFQGKSGIIPNLTPTALYLLARPSTPDRAIEQVEERIEQDQSPTVAETKEIIADTKRPAQADPDITVVAALSLIRQAVQEHNDYPPLEEWKASRWSLWLADHYHQRPTIDCCRHALRQIAKAQRAAEKTDDQEEIVFAPVWKLESALRVWLLRYDNDRQIQACQYLRDHSEKWDDVFGDYNWRKQDVLQAINNVGEQLRQKLTSSTDNATLSPEQTTAQQQGKPLTEWTDDDWDDYTAAHQSPQMSDNDDRQTLITALENTITSLADPQLMTIAESYALGQEFDRLYSDAQALLAEARQLTPDCRIN